MAGEEFPGSFDSASVAASLRMTMVKVVGKKRKFRRNKEPGFAGEIWPAGFSEVAEEYPYCSAYFRKKKRPVAKAGTFLTSSARLKPGP
jgi:uncharacterized Fe-S cluster-containing radical SAM superfamily protein